MAFVAAASAAAITMSWSGGPTTSIDARMRALPSDGIALRAPSGWVDRQGRPSGPSVVLELEHRVALGRIATEGMWLARWSSEDPAKDLSRWARWPGRRADVDIDGRRAQVHVERIGPSVLARVPLAWSLVRTRYRFVANDSIYEVGFWDGPGSRNEAIRRRVLDSVRLTPPTDRIVRDAGLELRVPGTWHRGTDCGECWFGKEAWAYVIRASARTVDEGALRIVAAATARGEPAESVPIVVDGQPAVRVRFRFQGDTDVEDLVIQRRDDPRRVVILATAWRTPAGRAELDAVVAGLVTRR
ncbi:MAG TPA: hypothetical protein VM143_00270 [Acidimicrobiales bacterium]|nr:hypothetical protein [Acidimicrobiales bacterium]